MNSNLEQRVTELIRAPRNVGELSDADAVGTVGNSSCGEFMQVWVKFKDQNGRKVIDRASFQSFGCDTAIAVASLATELIRGKTAEEALAMRSSELSGNLGPLPPMKIHCAELVEGALRSALEPASASPQSASAIRPASGGLLESFSDRREQKKQVRLLPRPSGV